MDNQNHRNTNLDFIRGLAAFLVAVDHLKHFLFEDSIQNPNFINATFAFLSNLGPAMVMIFFVLSGYLVGGSVIDSVQKERWSWGDYLTKRLVRLWVVLIPALLLIFFWDSLNIGVNGNKLYDGRFSVILDEIPGPHQYSLSLKTFFGNCFFLNGISCVNLGTNCPLWSLANEFWYYILFPFLYLSVFGNKSLRTRFVYGCIFIAFIFLLPKRMDLLGLVWLMGALIYIGMKNLKFSKITGNLLFFVISFTSLFTIILIGYWELFHGFIADHLQPGLVGYYELIGITFSGTMPYLLTHTFNSSWYKKTTHWLSEISYTLYLTHFPILAFFFFTFSLPERYQPSLKSYLIFCAYIALVLIYAYGVWYLFERRTVEVRNYTKRLIYKWGLELKNK